MRNLILGSLLLAAVQLSSCSSNTEQTADTAQAPAAAEQPAIQKEAQDFLSKAYESGLMKEELGKLAQEKGTSERLKHLGKLMATHHGRQNILITELAGGKGAKLPGSMAKEHQEHQQRLSQLTGEDFDRYYIDVMAKAHAEAMTLYREGAGGVEDEDIRLFATNGMREIESHEQMMKEMQERLGTGR